MPVTVGIALADDLLTAPQARRAAVVEAVEKAGIDYLTVGDHISFHDGTGFDGMVAAASLLGMSSTAHVQIGVYLLGLRHPLLSARALSTLSELAPGRLALGVGVGGEDRREIANSGVDPSTRGRRMDETLELLGRLLDGETVTHSGEFFTLDRARIVPSPEPRIPLLIGGSGEHAVRRTVRHGDGWLGIFCSARRFERTVTAIREEADAAGRTRPLRMGITAWVGLGRDEDAARRLLGERMESLYHLEPERFANVTAAGTPERVAEWLSAYRQAGAENFSLIPVAASADEAVQLTAEVAALLRA